MNTIRERMERGVVTAIARHDKLLMHTVMKRQYLIIKDLYALHDSYPDRVDADLVASFDAMFRLMSDVVERCVID